jgi:hypothetical protein
VTTSADEAGPVPCRPNRGAVGFRGLSLAGIAAFVAYALAVVAGAPRPVLTFVFNGLMLLVPPAVWWAYARAPAQLRRPLLLLALGATMWLIGSVVWEAFYLAAGNKVPRPPGVWDAFFIAAQLLVIAALVLAMRSLISVRLATLDVVIVTAAGVALAAPFVRHGLEHGADAASIVTLNRPILSIVVLMLIASAALRSWEGVPLSMAMLALAEGILTVGNLIYAFEAVQNRYVDERWATLAWGGGAIAALLAASTLILRIDRPVRLRAAARIPGHPVGSTRVLLVSLGGLLLSCGVAGYGLTIGSRGLAIAGLASCLAIGVAMAFRATDSIGSAESAYVRLDRALAETEKTRDDLARANAEVRAIQIAYGELLNLADERTEGRMRELIEETGVELAAMLEDEIAQRRGR